MCILSVICTRKFSFLVGKFSVYLNRRVFVMCVCGPFSRFFLGLTSKTDYLGLPESYVYFYTQGINEYIK